MSQKLLARLRRRARGKQLRVILDAGAAENHARLLELANHRNQVTIVRAPRRPAYRKRWAVIPKAAWQHIEEPGPYKNAPPKPVALAEMRMKLKSAARATHPLSQSVRTIIIREKTRRGKDRWHALWVFADDETSAIEIVREFRTRQHHEQTYRVMLHDAFVDTAASGYNKQSTNPKRPGFRQNALTIYAWVAALATNALDAWSSALPEWLVHAHPRTLRRWLLNVHAESRTFSE